QGSLRGSRPLITRTPSGRNDTHALGLICRAGAFLRVKPKTPRRQVSKRRAPGARYTRLMLNKCERRRPICTVLLLALFVISAASLLGFSAADVSLDAARHDYALNFFSVQAHVRLTKALYDKGQRLQAFYLLETARRARTFPAGGVRPRVPANLPGRRFR